MKRRTTFSTAGAALFAFFVKSSKTRRKMEGQVSCKVRFERAGSSKNPFFSQKKSASAGPPLKTEVMRGQKDLYILLDPRWPGAIYRSLSFIDSLRSQIAFVYPCFFVGFLVSMLANLEQVL